MGLWKDKIRGDWRYSFQHNRKSYAGGSFKTKAEARAAREERRKKIKESTGKQTPQHMGFRETASLYLDYAKRKFAKKTYKYKVSVYKAFLEFNKDMPIKDITPQHLHAYLDTRPSNNNYNAHRKDLCALFTYARGKLKIITYNPCWELERMPHTPEKKCIPTEKQVLQLIAAADPKKDERDLLLVVLHTLGRIDEALRLTWEDVNFENRIVTLWTRKRKDGAYEADPLPMNEDLYQVLWRMWNSRIQNKWAFYNEKTGNRFFSRRKTIKAICRQAGINPPFNWHAIRHFMATHLADSEKVSTKTVSGLLRHKNLKTTEMYLHTVDESQRAAMKSVEGKFTVSNARKHSL